jgi:hypothetical protein
MANKPLNIGEEVAVQMPMKTVASLIIIVALGTMGYFQIIERLNVADTRIQIMEKDLEENTEFRIKWPRGQLGSLPADSEQFMMIEDLYKTTDKLNKHIESSMAICLRGKREAERTFSESVTYKCWRGKAELEDNIDGSKSIKKLIIE